MRSGYSPRRLFRVIDNARIRDELCHFPKPQSYLASKQAGSPLSFLGHIVISRSAYMPAYRAALLPIAEKKIGIFRLGFV